jgi:hypothetical protein
MRALKIGIIVIAIICCSHFMPIYAQTAGPSGSREAPATASTPEQFSEYLKLSGIGEIWRARWVTSVDSIRSKGKPYWPESFWADIKDSMKNVDLGPVTWGVYKSSISFEMMRSVNSALRTESVTELAQTPLGQKFCALWQAKDQEGQNAMFALTESTLERVYERDEPAIKAARAKYIVDHPDWKD